MLSLRWWLPYADEPSISSATLRIGSLSWSLQKLHISAQYLGSPSGYEGDGLSINIAFLSDLWMWLQRYKACKTLSFSIMSGNVRAHFTATFTSNNMVRCFLLIVRTIFLRLVDIQCNRKHLIRWGHILEHYELHADRYSGCHIMSDPTTSMYMLILKRQLRRV